MAKRQQSSFLPRRGGAAHPGSGFSVDLGTGEGTYSYHIPLPAGSTGLTPGLVLRYSHAFGMDAWGMGWRLPVRSITRCVKPCAEDGDAARFFDGDKEIATTDGGNSGVMRNASFPRYRRLGDGWVVEEKSGVVHEFGLDPAARVAAPGPGGHVVEWLLQRTLDATGNAITYAYRHREGVAYLSYIRYGVYLVRLHYEARPDQRHDCRVGFLRRRTARCVVLDIVLLSPEGERLLGSYTFGYRVAPVSGVSQLAWIRHQSVGAPEWCEAQRPTVSFEYHDFDATQYRLRWMESEGAPPPLLSEPNVALVALDDSPLPGVLLSRAGQHLYWPNRGESWGRPRALSSVPQVKELGGDPTPLAGFAPADAPLAAPERRTGNGVRGAAGRGDLALLPPTEHPTPPRKERGALLRDFPAGGESLCGRRRNTVQWHGANSVGWGKAAPVPNEVLDPDFATPDIHLADLTGDGIKDLVRLQSGRVEYWPGLGGGRFGPKVPMVNAPRLRRDERRDTLLFVDVGGDGCADLVHLSPKGLTIYPNQNGQRFADPILVAGLTAPLPGTLRAVKLEGQKGMGLIWNSRAQVGTGYVHFRFAQRQPPYLLARTDDGAGCSCGVSYRSAAEDYRRDQSLNRCWRAPFRAAYLVVGGVNEADAVSGRVLEAAFRYHDPDFDQATGKFCGFAASERVEGGEGGARPEDSFRRYFRISRYPKGGGEYIALAVVIFAVLVLTGVAMGFLAGGGLSRAATFAAPPAHAAPSATDRAPRPELPAAPIATAMPSPPEP